MQELYERYKSLLFTLAYQMTGSVSDAEDAVQDVFVKIYDVKPERLTEPKAYLCKMVTNRCLDLLRSARKRREQYFGEWLPEPILTPAPDASETVIRGELLSYAMMVLLEMLSPAERAVFVLREALGFEHSAIAELLDKSEPNCRKLLSRARGKMGLSPDMDVPVHAEEASEAWVRRLLAAIESGQVNDVVSILSEDVVAITDGGGKAWAAVHPIRSADRVARFLLGLMHKAPEYVGEIEMELTDINGQAGLLIRSEDQIIAAVLLHVEADAVRNLYFIRNPDKLIFRQ
ncbi:RNA polymerase sigma factor SigJ [Paenibacillus sp. KQZ6P-2]|uniref:RNA polymerase sigma factor SigJ n=1 Tax=Paenibacillus mangrovi TaxID=2931978 RepID=A0A9X2B6N8_9BACL|nr:RNA polymerase sigma factor SigJ [Paenibacillus mangrovi]MCJ8012933.1 RNA polymerase sigma factor SigJ [Paenibacillus mangrovi]